MSDEEAVYKWVENPYWQLFCGYDYLQWKFPIHPTTLTKWRQRLGSEGIGIVLETIVKTAADFGMVQQKTSFSKVIADTIVMPKAVTFLTDAKLYLKGLR